MPNQIATHPPATVPDSDQHTASSEEPPAPRRPGRARDVWMRRRSLRIGVRVLAVLVLVAVAIPSVAWAQTKLSERRAYRKGRESARTMILTGQPILIESTSWNAEVFVDMKTGLPTSEPMMRCIYDPILEIQERGYWDEVRETISRGELARFDLRPKVRTEDEVLRCIGEHDATVVSDAAGEFEAPRAARHVTWTSLECDPAAASIELPPEEGEQEHVVRFQVRTPASILLADDGTTLYVRESTGAVQILDLALRVRVAWYGGPRSPNPRN